MSSYLLSTVLVTGRDSSCSHLEQIQNLDSDLPAPYGKLVLLIGKLGPKTWFELSPISVLLPKWLWAYVWPLWAFRLTSVK